MMKRFPSSFLLMAGFAAATLPASAQKPTALRVSLSRYFYDYQADPRKPLPSGRPVTLSDGSSALMVHPISGTGPWFGYGHAMWHRDNLTSMRRAGLDVALPVFRADAASLAGYAESGLDSMTQALQELRNEKQDYPLIGMYFDTSSLTDGGRLHDVGTEAGKARFFDAIQRFFRRIPPEFRAQAQTANGIANILVVGHSTALQNVDASLRAYVDGRFFAEFGRRLVWIGSDDWKSRTNNLDGYVRMSSASFLSNSEGPLATASLGPGYWTPPNSAQIPMPRNGGLTLLNGWRELFAKSEKPDWVFLESWNDYTSGTAVAGTREYGVRETDGMMAGLLQFRNEVGPVAQAMYVNAPDVVAPRSFTLIDIVAQNGTLDNWKPGDVIVSASWYRDGTLVDEAPKVPILQETPMMGVMELPVALAAVGKDGAPLAEGRYEVRVQLYRTSVDDKGALLETPFKEPLAVFNVSVGQTPPNVARLVSSDTLPWLMPGQPSLVKTIVRNDGGTPWPKAKTRLVCGLYRVKDGAAERLVSAQSDPLPRDVSPGDVTDPVVVALTAPEGTPPLAPGGPETYELRWSVNGGAAAETPVLEAPSVPARRVVSVLPYVSVAHFPLGNNAPPNWEAGKPQEVRTVVRNLGPATWKAGKAEVGCHWYYWDGTEAQWDGSRTPLPRDLKAGDEAMVRLNVTPPPGLGVYALALDVWDGERWLSTLPATAGIDLSLAWVTVTGGGWRCVDLTGLFDVDGVAGELAPGDGEFAGGVAFPAESVPPDVQPPLPLPGLPMAAFPAGISPIYYPAGYLGPLDTPGAQSIRRIPFRYPEKRDGTRNFLVCRGQSLPLGRGLYTRLYLLAAGTRDLETELTLRYTDSTTGKAPLKVSAWDGPPKNGEPVGLHSRFVRSAAGDDSGRQGRLFVYEVPLDPARVLESIVFPGASDLRIIAITAQERIGGPSFGASAPGAGRP